MRDFRSSHPAGAIAGSRLWYGEEVEGEHAGLMTAFIADRLNKAEMERLLASSAVRQWFFTETFLSWGWYAAELAPHAPEIVTAGVMEADAAKFFRVRRGLRLNVRAIVRVFTAGPLWVSDLGELDQVSVGEPYRLMTFARPDGVLTEPHQYEKDRA